MGARTYILVLLLTLQVADIRCGAEGIQSAPIASGVDEGATETVAARKISSARWAKSWSGRSIAAPDHPFLQDMIQPRSNDFLRFGGDGLAVANLIEPNFTVDDFVDFTSNTSNASSVITDTSSLFGLAAANLIDSNFTSTQTLPSNTTNTSLVITDTSFVITNTSFIDINATDDLNFGGNNKRHANDGSSLPQPIEPTDETEETRKMFSGNYGIYLATAAVVVICVLGLFCIFCVARRNSRRARDYRLGNRRGQRSAAAGIRRSQDHLDSENASRMVEGHAVIDPNLINQQQMTRYASDITDV